MIEMTLDEALQFTKDRLDQMIKSEVRKGRIHNELGKGS